MLDICSHKKSFMIILERSTSMAFSVHSLSLLKKLILHDWERLHLPRLMFIKLAKLTKILTRKNSMHQLLFDLSMKYKKLLWDKFVKEKRTFQKTFHCMQNFLELQYLDDDFFRITNVYHYFFPLNILFHDMDKELKHEKHFVDTICFFLQNCYGWLKLMTYSYNSRE